MDRGLILKPKAFKNSAALARFAVNLHFWAILIILAALFILYYSYLFGFNSFPLVFRGVAIFAYSSDLFSSLFLIPVLYSSYIFRIPGAIISSSVTAAILLIRPLTEFVHIGIEKKSIFVIAFFLAGVFVAIAQNRIQREKETLQELEKNRQAYLSQMIKVQEKERQRIALELHDDVVQTSLGLANLAQSLLVSASENLTLEQKNQIEQIKTISLDMSEHLKKMSRQLRPSILDHLGLLPAVQYTVNEFNKKRNIKLTLNVKGAQQRLPVEEEVQIFRIIQEALNNVKRHSQAAAAEITMDFQQDDFLISIRDNGKGMNLPEQIESLAVIGKLGLIGIHERARLANVSINIESAPGQGTLITLKRKSNQTSE